MKLTRAALCLLPLTVPAMARADVSTLTLGVDYQWRGVATLNPDGQGATRGNLNYNSQSLRVNLNTRLTPQLEADVAMRSLNVWGMEGTGGPLTRYPAADGTPWLERANARFTQGPVDLTFGRQSFVLGDGILISDDGLGFNALRADVRFPKDIGATLFTAKTAESLGTGDDSDLYAASVGLKRDETHWELSWVREKTGAATEYQLAGGTTSATNVRRDFLSLRIFGDLKDAYYKLELVMEDGNARLGPGGTETSIAGVGQRIEMGAQTDSSRWGRFGVKALYASGSGDDAGTPDKDEGFRATHAHRWDGLERSGYGALYGATLSDVFNSSRPFSSDGSGLPAGASGLKIMGLGLFTVQQIRWTAGLDYYLFDSRVKVSGANKLGSEADLYLTFRQSTFLTLTTGAAYFFPGDLYGPDASRVSRYTVDARVKF